MGERACVLLLGAGFTRNWGGWLASEAFEYLLGCPELDDGLRSQLWRNKDKGGFEAVLADLQEEHTKSGRTTPEPNLANLQSAIMRMFNDMNEAFSRSEFQFEFINLRKYQVREFLVRFDAIFTLNQDTLLEQHYLNGSIELSQRWNGWQIPGMRPTGPTEHPLDNPNIGRKRQDPENFRVSSSLQPYFKLHGSTNWEDARQEGLLVIGGNKGTAIDRHPILKWYFEQFKAYLARPNSRLMIIGYSFSDSHINNVLRNAVVAEGLELFVIDPLGVNVFDSNIGASIYTPSDLAKDLRPKVIGASRRTIGETFGSDPVEHSKVMRFLD